MKAYGRHLLVEYNGCNQEILNNIRIIEELLREAAVKAQATVVASVFHPFLPQGVTGVVVVEESHLSIHTWPEHGYAAVDFYTCGDCSPEKAHEFLFRALQAETADIMKIDRGMELPGTSMAVRTCVREQVAPAGISRTALSPSQRSRDHKAAGTASGLRRQ